MKPLLALALSLSLAAPTIAIADPVNVRQSRQDARIAHGAASGRLTACEAARLDHRTDRIARSEDHYRSTGGLQPWERANLQHRLNRSSRDIHEQNHDGRGCY
jgi:hypothetical protein